MKKVFFSVLCIIVASLNVDANELNLDNLLDTFAKNSDLSQKTKLENSGHTIVYTRDDLDRMMAKNLKDILKSYPTIGYRESRFGYPDILNMGGNLPFNSSSVRIMIDNHEVTTAFNGSGLALLGDIDLGFVDHVEIYALGPSFEHSSELTYMLIKLYSKVPQRDMGSKVEVNSGSYGYNFQSIYTANQLDKISYFAYFSHLDDKKKKYDSFDYPINRDQERYHFFTSIYKDDHSLKVQAIKNDKHASINYSFNATPTDDMTKYQFYNFNYDYTPSDDFKILLNYSNGVSKSSFADAVPYFCIPDTSGINLPQCISGVNLDVEEDIFSGIAKYTINSTNNKFVIGAGGSIKRFNYTSLKLNGIEFIDDNDIQMAVARDYNQRESYNIFGENQYFISENKVFTFGLKHDVIKNNGSISDDEITLFRTGYTYSNENFTSKTFIYNTTSLIDSALLKSNFAQVDKNLQPQQLEAISQEFKYSIDDSVLNLVGSYGILKNMIYQDALVEIKNSQDDIGMFAVYLNYDYIFDNNNKVLFDISYNKAENMPLSGDVTQYSGFVRGLNSIEKFDFYNELICRYDNVSKDSSYDYTVGINYHYLKDLNFYIKGENLFDKGYKDSFTRMAYDYSSYTIINNSNIEIAPIDRKVIIGLEYLF